MYPRTKVGGIWDQRSLRVRRRVRVRRHFLVCTLQVTMWTDCFHIWYAQRLWQDLDAYWFWARSEIQDGRRPKIKTPIFIPKRVSGNFQQKKFSFFPHLKNFSGLDFFGSFFFFFFSPQFSFQNAFQAISSKFFFFFFSPTLKIFRVWTFFRQKKKNQCKNIFGSALRKFSRFFLLVIIWHHWILCLFWWSRLTFETKTLLRDWLCYQVKCVQLPIFRQQSLLGCHQAITDS